MENSTGWIIFLMFFMVHYGIRVVDDRTTVA